VSLVGIALLVAAGVLLCATFWPQIGRGSIPRPNRAAKRRRKKTHLRVVRDEEVDEFARSVERDLANLPTIDEGDRR
jgi:hypothetical protein